MEHEKQIRKNLSNVDVFSSVYWLTVSTVLKTDRKDLCKVMIVIAHLNLFPHTNIIGATIGQIKEWTGLSTPQVRKTLNTMMSLNMVEYKWGPFTIGKLVPKEGGKKHYRLLDLGSWDLPKEFFFEEPEEISYSVWEE